MTSVSRTLLDLAAIVRPTELRLALAQADYRKLLDPARLIGSLQRGQPGSAALRRALAAHLPQLADAASVLEVEFLLVCERAALPMPEVNARVGRFRVDCLWRRERLVVELDGRDAHAYPAAFERDRQRDLELRALGFDVRRYSHHQVTKRPDEVLADLGAALARERPRAHRRRR